MNFIRSVLAHTILGLVCAIGMFLLITFIPLALWLLPEKEAEFVKEMLNDDR